MRRLHHPAHATHRSALRFVGFVLTLVGGGFTAVGLLSFFGAMAGGGMPQQFWCAFVGLPMLGFGTMLLKVGYLGAVTRYVAGEAAPVAVDVTNYVVANTADSLRRAARAVGEGLRGEGPASDGEPCPACHTAQARDANFCSACGAAMPREQACGSCHHRNPTVARFCNGCGAALAST